MDPDAIETVHNNEKHESLICAEFDPIRKHEKESNVVVEVTLNKGENEPMIDGVSAAKLKLSGSEIAANEQSADKHQLAFPQKKCRSSSAPEVHPLDILNKCAKKKPMGLGDRKNTEEDHRPNIGI